jgi:hypothetical protein
MVSVGSSVDAAMGGVDAAMSGVVAGACTGSIVCDDFESNSVAAKPATWQVVTDPPGKGTVLVDGTHSFSGSKSVRVGVAPGGGVTHVQMLKGFTLPTNEFYGRMMVRFTPFAVPSYHWNLIEGWGYMAGLPKTVPNQGMYEYGGVCSPLGYMGAAYLGPGVDCCNPSNNVPVPMTGSLSGWSCMEWHFDGINNEMQFWLDGQPVDSLSVAPSAKVCGNTWHAPVFERLDLGWAGGVPSNIEMWIDDVGVDSKRIGCPAPTASTH